MKKIKFDLDIATLLFCFVFATGLMLVSLFYCFFGLALVGAFGVVVCVFGIRYFSFENSKKGKDE